jgi:hypothetical protein
MNHFDLLYYCQACRDTHPMGVSVEMPNGPHERLSLNAYRATREIPASIIRLVGTAVLCPRTGKHIVTTDPNRIFIQPLNKIPAQDRVEQSD